MNNQPAFPTGIFTDEKGVIIGGSNGMTMRDYFAAKALLVVYKKNWDMFMDQTFESPEEAVKGAAEDAYCIADAMLKAREA